MPKQTLREMQAEALADVPLPAKRILSTVARSVEMNEGVKAMMRRADDFPSPLIALLSGIGVVPAARQHIDEQMNRLWGEKYSILPNSADEVIIGTGPHALIYASIRAAKGANLLILEKSKRAGGSFACSEGPSFILNSRNRPGPLGLPGDGLGLNVLPGNMLQPSMISGGEYQNNADLAWTIRMNLLMLPNVRIVTGVQVTKISCDRSRATTARYYNLDLKGNVSPSTRTLTTNRVVFATGVGQPKGFCMDATKKPARLLSFTEFMAKMDNPFPLQGMKRVAVIGAGDSGKTVIEALIGQGPTAGMSVPALDYVEKIDWYGCVYTAQEAWCQANRGRYSRIGKELGNRITPRGRASVYPTAGYEGIQIGPRQYDWVINCNGYTAGVDVLKGFEQNFVEIDGKRVARQALLSNSSDQVYMIGPAAQIPLSDTDTTMSRPLAAIPQNTTSIFRYAPLTAGFADSFPA